MSTADDSGEPEQLNPHDSLRGPPAHRTDTLLVETLMHALMEKGILTRNDALSVVQTVAQVQRGSLFERDQPDAGLEADIRMLQKIYESFELVESGATDQSSFNDNVVTLRPPVHGDRPEFPDDA